MCSVGPADVMLHKIISWSFVLWHWTSEVYETWWTYHNSVLDECRWSPAVLPKISLNDIALILMMTITIIITTRALRERRLLPMPKFETKMIRDSNLDFQINPDLGVCRICPKMLWMHYLVSVSHSAKYGTNRPLIVWKNANKCPKIPFRSGEENEKVIWNAHMDLAHHQKLIACRGSSLAHACQVWSTSVSTFVSYPVYRMTDRTIR